MVFGAACVDGNVVATSAGDESIELWPIEVGHQPIAASEFPDQRRLPSIVTPTECHGEDVAQVPISVEGRKTSVSEESSVSLSTSSSSSIATSTPSPFSSEESCQRHAGRSVVDQRPDSVHRQLLLRRRQSHPRSADESSSPEQEARKRLAKERRKRRCSRMIRELRRHLTESM